MRIYVVGHENGVFDKDFNLGAGCVEQVEDCRVCGKDHENVVWEYMSKDQWVYAPWGIDNIFLACPITNKRIATRGDVPAQGVWRVED